jgi:hypothetical protein
MPRANTTTSIKARDPSKWKVKKVIVARPAFWTAKSTITMLINTASKIKKCILPPSGQLHPFNKAPDPLQTPVPFFQKLAWSFDLQFFDRFHDFIGYIPGGLFDIHMSAS